MGRLIVHEIQQYSVPFEEKCTDAVIDVQTLSMRIHDGLYNKPSIRARSFTTLTPQQFEEFLRLGVPYYVNISVNGSRAMIHLTHMCDGCDVIHMFPVNGTQ